MTPQAAAANPPERAKQTLSPDEIIALQQVRDGEIGRWRWHADPAYVVYPDTLWASPGTGDTVTVVNETNGQSRTVSRHTAVGSDWFEVAAHDYFIAHPRRKPFPRTPGLYRVPNSQAPFFHLDAGEGWFVYDRGTVLTGDEAADAALAAHNGSEGLACLTTTP